MITVTDSQGASVGFRMTDRSGKIQPIALTVPDAAASLTPQADGKPFSSYTLQAYLEGYGSIVIEGLQVFAGETTLQPLDFTPLAELPLAWNEEEVFTTPPQNL